MPRPTLEHVPTEPATPGRGRSSQKTEFLSRGNPLETRVRVGVPPGGGVCLPGPRAAAGGGGGVARWDGMTGGRAEVVSAQSVADLWAGLWVGNTTQKTTE
ncbi:hypothetical protein WCLP8_5070001 [uncultured Gammaproteobacteria bacterium]